MIVDYDAGNLRSVQRALETFGALVSRSRRRPTAKFRRQTGLLCPDRVPATPPCVTCVSVVLIDPLRDYISSGKPFLGVCLGLQLLLDASDEGDEPCLGVIRGTCRAAPRRPEDTSHGLEPGELEGGAPGLRRMWRTTRTSTSSTATTPTQRTARWSWGPPTTASSSAARLHGTRS